MQVKKKKKITNNSTNFSLQVESVAQEDIFDFDKERIVKALIEEIECPIDIANKVANEVSDRLLKTNTEVLTPCLIRSFVNVVLCELGYEKQLQSNSEITISTNDIKGLIFNTDKNSGNVAHNPEGINLSIAENVMKQYTLKTIVPKNIAKKHLKGDIHIHDLGMFNRFYAFDGELNTVKVRNKKTNEISVVTFDELYNKYFSALYIQKEKINDSDVKYYDVFDFEIEDINGWTDITRLTMIPQEKDIYEVELENGEKIYLTEEHCCLKVNDNTTTTEIQLKDLKVGDSFYVN